MGRGDILKRIIDKLLASEPGKEKTPFKLKYFVILGLVGVILFIFSNLLQDKEPEQAEYYPGPTIEPDAEAGEMTSTAVSDIEQLSNSYEEDLVAMLNKIQGVSEAEVMVNLDSSDVKVYEKNLISGTQTTSEEDQNGGTRKVEDHTEDTQVVLVRQGDTEQPILVQTKRPEVRGVFIVAKGAEQASVKSWIIEAISSVLDVPSHQISVMPKD